MRILFSTVIALAALAVAVPTGAAPQRAKPALRIVDTSPLAVRGTNWHARERVRVRVSGETSAVRLVRATLAGAFTAQFPAVTVERCGDPLWITGIGASGARASVKLVLPECPPPLG